jgi:ABC-2 type transport system permease protein
MSTQSNPVPGPSLDSPVSAPPITAETRPMYWSVRREVWENRSIYIAPLIAGGVVILGSLVSMVWLPHAMREHGSLDPMHQRVMLAMPFAHVAMLIAFTAFIVGVFYSLDALYGERRDRSILFWKSLPVSDPTTVLSKASIPIVVLPLLIFPMIVILQVILLLLSSMVLTASGAGAGALWTRLPFFQMELVQVYELIVLALWHAPLYSWLLLVSAWAKRAPFLWAVLPVAAVAAFERLAFQTSYFGSLIKARVIGFDSDAVDFRMPDGSALDAHFIPLSQLTPGRFLTSAGLWIGLVFAGVFLAAAIRMRRNREPI